MEAVTTFCLVNSEKMRGSQFFPLRVDTLWEDFVLKESTQEVTETVSLYEIGVETWRGVHTPHDWRLAVNWRKTHPVLQIRRGNRDNFGIIGHISS